MPPPSRSDSQRLSAISRRQRLEAKPAPPPPDDPKDAVARINELSATARTLWFGLLSYFAFVGVTLLGVHDADFFVPDRRTQLPLLNISIPTETFFYFAPVLGAAFYTYLHHHLMKLWQALGEAPAMIRGRPLSDFLMPWIVIDLALDLRPDQSLRPQPLPVLANCVTVVLVFLAIPFVLACFWWRSMPVHSWVMTLVFCGMSLVLSLYVMVDSGRSLLWLRDSGSASWPARQARPRWLLPGWILFIALLTAMGFTRTVQPLGEIAGLDTRRQAIWNRAPFILSSAEFPNFIFVRKPDGWRDFQFARETFREAWCEREGIPSDSCGPATGLDMAAPAQGGPQPPACALPGPAEDCRHRLAETRRRFSSDWWAQRSADFAQVSMIDQWDELREVLEGAVLWEAQLEGADLNRADVGRTDFSEAQMEGARLVGAQLEGAYFWDTEMPGADLRWAQMEGADLRGAQMEGVLLIGAEMQATILRNAQLAWSDLREAQLQRADLSNAGMEGVNLSRANLEEANLRGADLRSSGLNEVSGARMSLRAADLTDTAGLTQDMVNRAWGDCATILPAGLRRPDHWDRAAIDPEEEADPAYQAWLDEGAPPGKPGLACPGDP